MSSDRMDTKNIKLEDGSCTTVALEPEFWMLLTKISQRRHLPFKLLIHEIDATRGELSRTGALRLYAARYFYQAIIEAVPEDVVGGRRLKNDRELLPPDPAQSLAL